MAIECYELIVHYIKSITDRDIPKTYWRENESPLWLTCENTNDTGQNSLSFGFFSSLKKGEQVIQVLQKEQDSLKMGLICIYRLRDVVIPGLGWNDKLYYILDHFLPDSNEVIERYQRAVRFDILGQYLDGDIILRRNPEEQQYHIVYHPKQEDETIFAINYV